MAIDSGKKFSITSSFIVENRGNGGISAQSPAPGSQLEFNTIADNQDAGNGVLDAGGVFCDQPDFAAPNNIIFRNTSNGTSEFVQTIGRCGYGNSLVSANNAAETRILGFVKDTMPRDYHLTSSSPALVKNAASCVAATGFVDYDGIRDRKAVRASWALMSSESRSRQPKRASAALTVGLSEAGDW